MKEKMLLAILIAAVIISAVSLLTGCAATQKQLAQNLQQKSLMGDGIVTVNQITVTDPATESYCPELKSIFISGKFFSLLKDANFLSYDRKSSASTFNASAITTTETLVIQSSKQGDLAEIVKAISKIQQHKAPDQSGGTAK